MQRPGRPFGLSLAILLSVMMFSVFPLMQAVFVLTLRAQFSQIEFWEGGGAYGGAIDGVSDLRLAWAIISGVGFLIIAVFAWRGRPAVARYWFMGAVAALTVVSAIGAMRAIWGGASLDAGIDSAADVSNTLALMQVIASVLIALYVIWYANRGPARAFYRGHHLSTPDNIP